MTRSHSHFEEFAPHSRYKQLILKTYFESWGRKLLLRPGAGASVLFVDACAGRGTDDLGNHGSPVIAAKAAAMAQAQLAERFGRAVQVQVIAIEKKPSHFKALRELLRPFGVGARVLQGDFAQHIPTIATEFAGVPALWFIDPFGIEALDSTAVRQALAGDKSEALIMFLDQGALRHFGVAIADETETERRFKALESDLNLFPDLQEKEREALAPKVEKSRASLGVTRDKSIEILNAALERADWQEILERTPRAERTAKLLEMYLEVLVDTGAHYVTKVPVLNAKGDHVYYLIHAAKNKVARRTMKEAVEYALKHGPLPPETVVALRQRLVCNLGRVESFLRARLAGQTVRWAVDRNDKSAISVRNLSLEETDIHPGQLDELKARLASMRLNDKSIVYRFPG